MIKRFVAVLPWPRYDGARTDFLIVCQDEDDREWYVLLPKPLDGAWGANDRQFSVDLENALLTLAEIARDPEAAESLGIIKTGDVEKANRRRDELRVLRAPNG